MTPEQALQVLDQVTQGISLVRKDHETVINALNVLSALVQKCNQCCNEEKCPNQ
jgi:hypothetical protein